MGSSIRHRRRSLQGRGAPVTPRPSQRDSIMCAALTCFAHTGYDGTRVRQIAQAAGVSEGALYKHFASKEQLARDLYLQGLGIFADALKQAAEGAAVPVDKLRRMAARVLTGYRELPDEFAYVLLQAPPAAACDLPSDRDLPIDVVAGIIEQGQAEGSVRQGDARTLSASFLGCLLQRIVISRSTPSCVSDLLHDDSSDEMLVESAIGAVVAH